MYISLGSVDLGQAATQQQGRTPEVQRIGRQRGAFGLASDLKTVVSLGNPEVEGGLVVLMGFDTRGEETNTQLEDVVCFSVSERHLQGLDPRNVGPKN